jgi:hypothetical protein
MDENLCPLVLRDKLAIHVPFNRAIIQYALEHWPDSDAAYKQQGKAGPYYYNDSVYQSLSL